MAKPNDKETEKKNEKWDFDDYAFTLATVLFLALQILPHIKDVLTHFDSLGDIISQSISRFEWFELYGTGIDPMNIYHWQPFAWMFFMLAWVACEAKNVIDIRRGVEGIDKSLEDAAEDALYIGITVAMLFFAIITGRMYASWLAGPITFILLAVILPFLRNSKDKENAHFPAIPLLVLSAGIIVEVFIGGWIAISVSWIFVCAYKIYGLIRKYSLTEDVTIDVLYYAFSIILISIGLVWGLWITSWLAFPIAIVISKAIGRVKSKRFSE